MSILEIKDRRIAIIGGAGFIGHHMALTLKELGADIHVVDSLQVNNLLEYSTTAQPVRNRDLYLRILNERLDLLRAAEVPLHVQDARDYGGLSKTLREINPQVIVHLAAISHAGKSNKNPYSTFDHSLRTLENALDYARGHVEQFIYFSSSTVYGHFKTASVDEETHCEPFGMYASLKFAGEKMVMAYNHVFDLPYTIIRPSALYGQRCVSRRVGQIFIENALQGHKLRLNGGGAEKLDFTYINDLVGGIVNCIENTNSYNEIFNMTYGSARSIADLATITREYFPDIQLEESERDTALPIRGTLSVDKARRLIGYDPQYPIDTGFREYIEWYQSLENA